MVADPHTQATRGATTGGAVTGYRRDVAGGSTLAIGLAFDLAMLPTLFHSDRDVVLRP